MTRRELPTCPAQLIVDTLGKRWSNNQIVCICERAEGYKGKHGSTRVSRKNLFVTIEWNVDCYVEADND